MAAPWRIVFDEHILGIVHDNIVVVLGDNDGDWAILLFRDGFTLDAGLNLASDKIIDEFANVLCIEFFVSSVGELLVVDSILNGKGGPDTSFEVEIGGVLTKGCGVDGCKAEFALVFLGQVGEFGGI